MIGRSLKNLHSRQTMRPKMKRINKWLNILKRSIRGLTHMAKELSWGKIPYRHLFLMKRSRIRGWLNNNLLIRSSSCAWWKMQSTLLRVYPRGLLHSVKSNHRICLIKRLTWRGRGPQTSHTIVWTFEHIV